MALRCEATVLDSVSDVELLPWRDMLSNVFSLSPPARVSRFRSLNNSATNERLLVSVPRDMVGHQFIRAQRMSWVLAVAVL